MAEDAPLLWPEFGTNVAYHFVKEGGDVDGVFAKAEHTLSLRCVHSRLAQVPMEPRGILASYDKENDFLTVWRSTQSPFGTRGTLAQVLGRPADSIRVIAPDVGGGFGAKGGMYPDELVAVLMSIELGRPVRWVSTRMEDLLFTMQGRDQMNLVDVAYTSEGILTGLKVKTIFNIGGVLLTHGSASVTSRRAPTASWPTAPRRTVSTPIPARPGRTVAPAVLKPPTSPSRPSRRWRRRSTSTPSRPGA
jgi:carbon-monoxide dehydrogenase large subunit